MRYKKKIGAKAARLDFKDKKILSILSDNSRTAQTAIAKKVGLSKDAVRYRIAKLEEAGVIQDYKTIVDIKHLGYEASHILLQLLSPDDEIETLILERIKKHTFVRAIIKFSGRYDFDIAIAAKNLEDLEDKICIILSECEKHLQDYEIIHITKTYITRAYPLKFFKEENKTSQLGSKKTQYTLDQKDMHILDELFENATSPVYQIAQKVELSSDATKKRMRKMKDAGVITKHTVGLDYSSMGYQMYVLIFQIPNLIKDADSKAKEIISRNTGVVWAVKTIGKYNLMLYLCTEKPDDLHSTIKEFRRVLGGKIKTYESLIAYEEYKYTYLVK